MATLSLLFLISCGITTHSFVLRRRYRRNVRGVLTAGGILPSTFGGRGFRKDFGDEPKFYDVWVQPGEEKWEGIMVSDRILFGRLWCNHQVIHLFSPYRHKYILGAHPRYV